MVSGQLPPRKIAPPPPTVRVGLWVKVRVSFRVGGTTRQLPPRKIVLQLGLGLALGLVLRLGSNFLQGQLS